MNRYPTAVCVSLALILSPAPARAQLGPATSEVPLAQRLLAAAQFDSAATVLERVVVVEPANGRAWLMLGRANRRLGRYAAASDAFQKGLAIPATRRPAALALFLLAADSSRGDDAVRWLGELRTTGIDFTTLVGNREVERLRPDPRFAALFPDQREFDRPFAEGVRIIHEWRGDSAGGEFGWIARGIGDVDRDSITDIAVSGPGNPPFGSRRGDVYVYSGRSGALLWRRAGETDALLGTSLEAAGDVNADGVPDVIAGAPGINAVLVFSGRDGAELLRLRGDSADHDLGTSAAGIGDFDGDGHADLVAGAPRSDAGGAANGRAYVFSGKNGSRLFVLDGEKPGDGFGSSSAASMYTIACTPRRGS